MILFMHGYINYVVTILCMHMCEKTLFFKINNFLPMHFIILFLMSSQ
jgi:hypothetical protein